VETFYEINNGANRIEGLLSSLEKEIESQYGMKDEVCSMPATQELERVRIEIEELKQKLQEYAQGRAKSDPGVVELDQKLNSLLSKEYMLWLKCREVEA
jgi:hypothetical protein